VQNSRRVRLYLNPGYDAGSADTSLNGQFRIMTLRSVRVIFENDKHVDATGTVVCNRKLTGSYCNLIHVILNDSISTI
jgi:hypothetical protein